MYAAGAIDAATRRLRDDAPKRRALHARCPDLGDRLDPLHPGIVGAGAEAEFVDPRDHRSEVGFDADTFQVAGGTALQRLGERRQHGVLRVQQHDPGLGGIDPAEIAAQ